METSLTPQQASRGPWTIVDVRSASERAAACVPGSVHLPLERVETGWPALGLPANAQVALLCKAGTRARLAQDRLAACGISCAVIEGGIDRWQREGLHTEQLSRSRWSLERQVRFGAGALTFAGTLAAAFVSTKFLLFTGFIGAGLMFAGATDICMMGNALARMPWNRARRV